MFCCTRGYVDMWGYGAAGLVVVSGRHAARAMRACASALARTTPKQLCGLAPSHPWDEPAHQHTTAPTCFP